MAMRNEKKANLGVKVFVYLEFCGLVELTYLRIAAGENCGCVDERKK